MVHAITFGTTEAGREGEPLSLESPSARTRTAFSTEGVLCPLRVRREQTQPLENCGRRVEPWRVALRVACVGDIEENRPLLVEREGGCDEDLLYADAREGRPRGAHEERRVGRLERLERDGEESAVDTRGEEARRRSRGDRHFEDDLAADGGDTHGLGDELLAQ